jgi:valyl-tRNA synthetase
MGYEFMKEKPFSDVYIHQLVRDKYGRKMSKSLGNGIDPIEVIDKFGADPMRFTLALMAAQGKDINLDVNYIENNKKFANKIWNATRFVILNLDDFKEVPIENLKLSDKWILSKVQKTITNVTDAIENYEFNIAAKEIYTFFWDELCDWYIEIAKPRLKTNERHLVQNVLVYVLDKSLKLLHPFMPFITEELWQKLPVSTESITVSEWPKVEEKFINEDSEKHFNLLMNIIRGIRNIKAEVNIPQSKKVNISINKNITDEEKLYIQTLANVEKINISEVKPEKSASAYIGSEIEVYVELGELINIDSEIERLSKKIEKLETDAEKFRKKLSNKKFLEGAPEEIINETKEKLKDIEEKINKINVIVNSLK